MDGDGESAKRIGINWYNPWTMMTVLVGIVSAVAVPLAIVLSGNLSSVQSEIANVRSEIRGVRDDVDAVRTDIKEIVGNIGELKGNIGALEGRVIRGEEHPQEEG